VNGIRGDVEGLKVSPAYSGSFFDSLDSVVFVHFE
jgi:hypothetical protein